MTHADVGQFHTEVVGENLGGEGVLSLPLDREPDVDEDLAERGRCSP